MDSEAYLYVHESALGKFTIASEGGAIVAAILGELSADILRRKPAAVTAILNNAKKGGNALITRTAAQLDEYLCGKRRCFDLPLRLHGTPFQLSVWNALRDIPFGETRNYKQIAAAIGKPNACRAVGNANNKNPISIIIPCHRVIGTDGGLTGYGGGLDVKARLLALERDAGNRFSAIISSPVFIISPPYLR